jgi:hypothetical protein
LRRCCIRGQRSISSKWPLPDGKVLRLEPTGHRELERCRLIARSVGVSIAVDDELTLRPGTRRWHCSIASCRNVADPPADAGPGIARSLDTARYRPVGKRETFGTVDRSES